MEILAFWGCLIMISGVSAQDLFCNRPAPLSLSTVSPEFDVYAPNNLHQKFTLSDINKADFSIMPLANAKFFKKGRQVVFMVHGYFGNLGCQWFLDMKDAVMKADDSTVIVVNWPWGASHPLYGVSASTTQTVASAIGAIADSISRLAVFGGSINPNDIYFYCIGHSLGAHICGQAGRRARGAKNQQLFNRVTALDPASPGFESCTDKLRVDKDSALCVDVIHTDGNLTGHTPALGLVFGTMRQWGHIDFYPNGGADQPVCGSQWLSNDAGCSHDTAIEYFSLSLRTKNSCMAVGPCTNPQDLRTCKTQSQSMGYYSSCYRRSWSKVQGAFFSDVIKQNRCVLQGPKYCPPAKG